MTNLVWRRSGRCESNACVFVAFDGDEVLVRGEDPDRVLRFTRSEWLAFTGGVKAGEFDPVASD